MNPFIDDLHRPVVTQNRLTFQALLPEVTQEQVLYNEKVWALLRHSRRIFFIYIFFCFWIPIKIPWNNLWRKLVFMVKSTASWRTIWAPESLHCSYDKRCIRLPQPLSFTKERVCTHRTWRRFNGIKRLAPGFTEINKWFPNFGWVSIRIIWRVLFHFVLMQISGTHALRFWFCRTDMSPRDRVLFFSF